MIDTNAEYFEYPIPHIVVRDFITNTDIHEFLRHNTELTDYFDESPYGNLERIEMTTSKEKSGQFTLHLPHNDFSPLFNETVSTFLDELETSKEFDEMVKKHFLSEFQYEYGDDFNESFTNKTFTYGAYNGCDEAKNLIGWHLDQGDKLVVGFVYIREEGDTSDDGHLYFCDGTDNIMKELRYEDNVMVLWPNLSYAWHKAGVRFPTDHLRRIINIAYKTDEKSYHDYRTLKSKTVVNPNELYENKIFGIKEVKKNEQQES